jgi:hypothetical protein
VRESRSRRGQLDLIVLESLDYLYLPAPDIEASIRFYTEALGAEQRLAAIRRSRIGRRLIGRPSRKGVGAARRPCSPMVIPLSYSRLSGDNRPQTGASSALS